MSYRSEGFRLSPQQRRLWTWQQDGHAARAQCALQIEGDLRVEVLREAVRRLVRRHEILRTAFQRPPGIKVPLQVITDQFDPSWCEIDLSQYQLAAQEEVVERLFQEEKSRPFDFSQGPLWHLSLLTLSIERHVLFLSLPALCADSRTLNNLAREISRSYGACLQGAESADELVQYVHFSEWQNELLAEEQPEADKVFWSQHNIASLSDRSLPFINRPAGATSFEPATLALHVDAALAKKLKALGHEYEVSAATLFLTCWQILLWRLTDQADITIGTACDGRSYEELKGALGLFAKNLPVPCRLEKNTQFYEALQLLEEAGREARKRQDSFFWEHLVAANRKASRQLFTPFCYEYEVQPPKVEVGGVSFAIIKQYACTERFEVKLSCLSGDDFLRAEFHYDAALCAHESIARLRGEFAKLLESASAQPTAKINQLDMLDEAERQQLLGAWNETQAAYPPDCIHQLFEAQATRAPDAIAFVYEDQALSYRELNEQANQLAHYLQTCGVRPEELVGVCLNRSSLTVVALLAVLKAGGAYVPLDPSYPLERLAWLVEDAGVQVLLTEGALRERLADTKQQVICLDTEWPRIAQEPRFNPAAEVSNENLAYVIYTSGSTGRPKGVSVEQRQLLNYLHAFLSVLDLPARASFATVSTIAADLGNSAIFPALCTGGCLHLIAQDRAMQPAALAEYFQRHQIDCLKIVPSHMAALQTSTGAAQVMPRKRLVLGGEACGWDLVKQSQAAAPACLIINHYGPTETTVGVLTYRVNSDAAQPLSQTVPLGRPLANTRMYVLDGEGQPLPLGLVGELFIGGRNVARGYLHNAELTAGSFVPDGFSGEPGARLYRTGDLVRYLPDGNLEFIRRVDQQVKIRGNRVELAEVEAVLCQHAGVRAAVLAVREELPGDRRLVAYVVPELKHTRNAAARQFHTLPNALTVAHLNKNETEHLYRQIFEDHIYLRHGITYRDGDCIFDVGANIGLFSLFAHEMCQNPRVYAFEPSPYAFEKLRLNAEMYGLNVQPFEFGLSRENGTANFTTYPRASVMSGFYADAKEEGRLFKTFMINQQRSGTLEVASLIEDADEIIKERFRSENILRQLRTISGVIREHGIERIDLLKVDVEKSEVDVLEGVEAADWPKIKQVIVEVHNIGGRVAHIADLLRQHGFQVTVEQDATLDRTYISHIYAARAPSLNETARGGGTAAPLGPPRLGASPDVLVGELRSFLRQRLPDYMIPSAFVLLAELPLTPNGKVDRQALPAPELVRPEQDTLFVAPRTAVEATLADIWTRVLGIERIGVHDNFFALGGDSILSIQIIARANQAGLRLSPKHVFQYQSIAELAAVTGSNIAPDAEQGIVSGLLPLTPSQHTFLAQELDAPQHFNLALWLDARAALEPALMERAARQLFIQHDSLRLRFIKQGTCWAQFNAEVEELVPFTYQDLSTLNEREQQRRLEQTAAALQASLNLAAGPLMRLALFNCGVGSPSRLLFIIHPLVGDGFSCRLLLEDLQRGYEQLRRGEELWLGLKTASYKRWAEGLSEYAQQPEVGAEMAYWLAQPWQLGSSLPLDHAGGANTFESAQSVSSGLSLAETRTLLHELPEAYRAQLNDALLMALTLAFVRWSGGRALLVDLMEHGRGQMLGDTDVTRTTGWFATTFPLVLEVGETVQPAAALRRIKEQLRAVPQHGSRYGLLRYLRLDGQSGQQLSALPQPEVSFNYRGQIGQELPESSFWALAAQPEPPNLLRGPRRYLIEVYAQVVEGALQLTCTYSENIHRRETIEAFAQGFLGELRGLLAGRQPALGADYSPSDFPLAGLNQQQLEKIISKVHKSKGEDHVER